MVNDTYKLLQNDEATQFVFYSEGKSGRIMKAIIISPYEQNRWNLAFGDVHSSGGINDSAITNNQDVVYNPARDYEAFEIYLNPG